MEISYAESWINWILKYLFLFHGKAFSKIFEGFFLFRWIIFLNLAADNQACYQLCLFYSFLIFS